MVMPQLAISCTSPIAYVEQHPISFYELYIDLMIPEYLGSWEQKDFCYASTLLYSVRIERERSLAKGYMLRSGILESIVRLHPCVN